MSQSNIYTTFGIEATADRFLSVDSEQQLQQLAASGQLCQSPCMVLGGGSNVIFAAHYHGTVLHLENKGIALIQQSDAGHVIVEMAAGELWDDAVRHCAAHGWHGLENLVAIPGQVGAAPVQNIGAYGVEAKDFIYRVRVCDLSTGAMRWLDNDECHFAYRDSIFKRHLKGRCAVVAVQFRLATSFCPNTRYAALQNALAGHGCLSPSPQQLIDILTDLRWSKLPRPEVLGSAGSFFKNPVVAVEHYERLRSDYPDLVAYAVPDGYKLAAGWLIDRAGWRGRRLGRCGVYDKQALVLVNHGGCTVDELLHLIDAIRGDVRGRFHVDLECEAELI